MVAVGEEGGPKPIKHNNVQQTPIFENLKIVTMFLYLLGELAPLYTNFIAIGITATKR